MSALGTYRGTVNDLLPSAMVSEPFDNGEAHRSIDSESATQGSDPLIGIRMNSDAAHSTVIIKPPRSSELIDTSDEGLSGTVFFLFDVLST